MRTETLHRTLQRNLSSSKKYGITESKKAEIDSLALQVQDAQYQVELYQSIVSAMNEKSVYFQSLLTVADTTRAQALNNQNLVHQIVESEHELVKNNKVAFEEIEKAEEKTDALATNIKIMMDKLIYSVEIINKLTNIVIRKKAVNPLISDELVAMLGTAGKDANNVISLALVALKSTFAAQASTMETKSAVELSYIQAQDMLQLVTGAATGTGRNKTKNISLQSLLQDAYTNAKTNYVITESALNRANTHLNEAKRELNASQVNLKSLQAGLAAANAAALAS